MEEILTEFMLRFKEIFRVFKADPPICHSADEYTRDATFRKIYPRGVLREATLALRTFDGIH